MSDYISSYRVEAVHSNYPISAYNDGDMLRTTPSSIPELLYPVHEYIRTLYDSWQPFWFELDTKGEVAAGEYDITVRFIAQDDTVLG